MSWAQKDKLSSSVPSTPFKLIGDQLNWRNSSVKLLNFAPTTVFSKMQSVQKTYSTPSAAYRMLSIPDALDLVLEHTAPLEPVEVPFQKAFQHTLAEDVLANEPVPGFRASIKVSLLS